MRCRLGECHWSPRDVLEEGGGGLGPKSLCTKMARQDFPNGKFRFPPRWSLWSEGRPRGGGYPPPPPTVCSHSNTSLRPPPPHGRLAAVTLVAAQAPSPSFLTLTVVPL